MQHKQESIVVIVASLVGQDSEVIGHDQRHHSRVEQRGSVISNMQDDNGGEKNGRWEKKKKKKTHA